MRTSRKTASTRVLNSFCTIQCTRGLQCLFMLENLYVSPCLLLNTSMRYWPQNPVLQADPYEKALTRFWVKYSDDLLTAVGALFKGSSVEERKKDIENIWEHFRVVEDQCLGKQKKFFGGDIINVVDLAFGSIIKFLTISEDIFEVDILEAEKFPSLYSWFNNFKSDPVIAENLPNKEKMVAFVKSLRERTLASS
ncbi:glutathione S-transferase [Spatholobus suberectus]|nr:glutathione S-transferase [Spatholobus suberectus]